MGISRGSLFLSLVKNSRFSSLRMGKFKYDSMKGFQAIEFRIISSLMRILIVDLFPVPRMYRWTIIKCIFEIINENYNNSVDPDSNKSNVSMTFILLT